MPLFLLLFFLSACTADLYAQYAMPLAGDVVVAQQLAQQQETGPPATPRRNRVGEVGEDVREVLEQSLETVREEAESSLLPSAAVAPEVNWEPITGRGRVYWTISSTVGPANLGAGLFKAGFQTLIDDPEEWDTHWKGFGQRYGLRLTGNATSNLMEAGLGAVWGEDPRYHRSDSPELSGRVWSIVKGTWMATDRAGREVPAYARMVAVPASNFVSNAWRPDSQTSMEHTLGRIGIGLVSRMASNAFYEFWPDVKKLIGK